MGIFTSNTSSSIGGVDYSTLPALEGYDAVTGCAQAMLEVHQNDMALFNATIMEDFKEVAAVNEGYEVEVINESASDVLNKIKEVFKKLLQKIKGIFNAFIAKLAGTFATSDKLYSKYVKQITRYTNWEKFEVKKFRDVKGSKGVLDQIEKVGAYSKNIIYFNIANSPTASSDTDDINTYLVKNRILNKDLREDLDTDLKNMDVAFMDAVYEAEETKDEWKVSDIISGNIGTLLEKNAGKKFKDNIESANKNLSDSISKIINELDKDNIKIQKLKTGDTYNISVASAETNDDMNNGKQKHTYSKIDTGKGYTKMSEDSIKKLQECVAYMQKLASQEQTLITAFTSARLKATKFAIAQARRVWSSAAAYSSMEHKNEGYEFYTAIGEASEYDFISDMEAIHA